MHKASHKHAIERDILFLTPPSLNDSAFADRSKYPSDASRENYSLVGKVVRIKGVLKAESSSRLKRRLMLEDRR